MRYYGTETDEVLKGFLVLPIVPLSTTSEYLQHLQHLMPKAAVGRMSDRRRVRSVVRPEQKGYSIFGICFFEKTNLVFPFCIFVLVQKSSTKLFFTIQHLFFH